MSTSGEKERTLRFLYLLGFYIIMSVIFYFAVFHNTSVPDVRNKSNILAEIESQNKLLEEHGKYQTVSDSITRILMMYNPGSNQVYHESSLNYELEELRKGYSNHPADDAYKILKQLEEFYSMQYYDKKATWNSVKNADYFRKNLEDCEIGFQQLQNNLQLQEALKNTKDNKETK